METRCREKYGGSRSTSPPWENPPCDILETVFKNLPIGDRVRVGAVCRYWNLVLRQAKHDILGFPDAPWQILSDNFKVSSCRFEPRVTFRSLSEGKEYQFKLPAGNRQGWLCGSSHGWLLMATGYWPNPDLFLWNPVNRSTRDLPRLSTHPCYGEFVGALRDRRMDDVSCLFDRFLVFSHGPVECAVAAIFNKRVYDNRRVSFCTPRDERWTTYDGDNGIAYIDVMYHEKVGSLRLLAPGGGGSEALASVDLSGCTVPISISFFDGIEDAGEPRLDRSWDACMSIRANRALRLVEDENGDVLVVETVIDRAFRVDGEHRDREVKVLLHVAAENRYEELDSIGNRAIFLGPTSSSSIIISNPTRRGVEADCVFLEIDDSSRYWSYHGSLRVQEHGIYSLKSKKMSKYYFLAPQVSIPSKLGWLEPKILLK